AFADSLVLDFSGTVEFTDFDGDTIDLGDETFMVTVVDDIPVAFSPDHAFVYNDDNNEPGTVTTVGLDFAPSVGADETGDVRFTQANEGIAHDADGNEITFNDGNGNMPLYIFVSPDGHTLRATTDISGNDAGQDVYTLVLNPEND